MNPQMHFDETIRLDQNGRAIARWEDSVLYACTFLCRPRFNIVIGLVAAIKGAQTGVVSLGHYPNRIYAGGVGHKVY